MSQIEELKKIIVAFLLNKKIPLTLDFYMLDFQKIGDIFTFLKALYIVFFQKIDTSLFYEFIQYVLREFYGYKFVQYRYVNNEKSCFSACLMFESNQFNFYLTIQQKQDGKLSIRPEFSLKLKTVHQGKERRYTISKAITSGSYGKVYLCVDEHGNQFAMKMFQLKDEMDFEMNALRHLEDIDQVITPLDAFDFNILGIEFGAFVMPFMNYTLKSFVEIQNLKIQTPSEDFLLHVFYGLLLDLRKIHNKGCYHMDLKPENILMDLLFDGTVDMKLADFGLAEILPEGTNYATTPEPKVTLWFRCPVNALAEANKTQFHISWIADFFALCVSMVYMCSYRQLEKKFIFLENPIFDIFRGQQFFKSNRSDDKLPKELNVEFSKIRIESACRIAIKNPFLCDILIEYMNPASILRWYSELEMNPNNNSVIMEVIFKIKVYFRMRFVVSQLKEHFKKSESDVDTPPRPRAYVLSP